MPQFLKNWYNYLHGQILLSDLWITLTEDMAKIFLATSGCRHMNQPSEGRLVSCTSSISARVFRAMWGVNKTINEPICNWSHDQRDVSVLLLSYNAALKSHYGLYVLIYSDITILGPRPMFFHFLSRFPNPITCIRTSNNNVCSRFLKVLFSPIRCYFCIRSWFNPFVSNQRVLCTSWITQIPSL